MEKIIELLQDINDSVDYNTCVTLIDDGIFDSFDIIQTISAINEEFDISIPAKDIVPENFNSAETLFNLVQRLLDEQ